MMSKEGGKLSVNVHLTVPTTSAEEGSNTPNTPEILNSILNMQYTFDANQQPPTTTKETTGSNSTETASGSVMSVQQYRSAFIKESLKMKVQQKLATSPMMSEDTAPSPCSSTASVASARSTPSVLVTSPDVKSEALTMEDELRRHRRRERNKIAATKCRNKKKIKAQLLLKESDTLETQNQRLRSEIETLQVEQQQLTALLAAHRPHCTKSIVNNVDDVGSSSSMVVDDDVVMQALAPTVTEVDCVDQGDDGRRVYGACGPDAFLGDGLSFTAKLDAQGRCIAL